MEVIKRVKVTSDELLKVIQDHFPDYVLDWADGSKPKAEIYFDVIKDKNEKHT